MSVVFQVFREVIASRLHVAPDPLPEPFISRGRRDGGFLLFDMSFKDEFASLIPDRLLWFGALSLHDRPPGGRTWYRSLGLFALLHG